MRLVMLVVLGAVFLILAVSLRALIAPLFLLGSVVLSYGAALGLTVLVWADLLGHPIEWFLPVMTFVILVAVGADYNLLVMARIREETRDRAGIAKALVSTGAVVTSAGLIFAGSFVALLASPLTGIAEAGFTVAVGLLLDTLVIRTLIVPAAAMLLGPTTWWPNRTPDASAPPN
jgi:RND superfamily putative drug exporter